MTAPRAMRAAIPPRAGTSPTERAAIAEGGVGGRSMRASVGVPLWWAGMPHAPRRGRADRAMSPSSAADSGLWTAYYLMRARPDLAVVVPGRARGLRTMAATGGGCPRSSRRSREVGAATRHGGHQGVVGGAAAYGRGSGDVVAAEEIRTQVSSAVARWWWRAGGARGGRGRWSRTGERGRTGPCGWTRGGSTRLDATRVRGRRGLHTARVQPWRWSKAGQGSAGAGGSIVEGARVGDGPGRVVLADGRVVRTRPRHPGHGGIHGTDGAAAAPRGPVYSLPRRHRDHWRNPFGRQWVSRAGEVFADHRHVVVYGQRSVDDRLVFGGLGALSLGSAIRPEFDRNRRVFGLLRAGSPGSFRSCAGYGFTRAWGGPLAIPRDWHPSVGYDAQARVGWAGGYVGDGWRRAASRGACTLADLMLDHCGAHGAAVGRTPFSHGNPSHCAGWASTPGCGSRHSPTPRNDSPDARPGRAGCSPSPVTGRGPAPGGGVTAPGVNGLRLGAHVEVADVATTRRRQRSSRCPSPSLARLRD